MRLLPASSELAANAGTGPEGHKRSASVDSGASSNATMVASDIDWIDHADMGAVDGCHKLVAIEKALTSPPERAACNEDPAVHDAKHGRVSTDTASGAPALDTHTTTAGSPTAAAPSTESIDTATALAVADPDTNALNEPDEASDAVHDEPAPAHSAPAPAARDAASSAAPDVISAGTPAPATSAIVGPSIVDHGPAPASASVTIDANPASRGHAGCPETPVISRRPHVVAGAVPIRAFAIGRTSSPVPVPGATLAALLALLASATGLHGSGASLASPAPAGDAKTPNTLDTGSKSAVIVANATSRVHVHCPSTPVVSRLPLPRSHAIADGAVPAVHVNGNQFSAFTIGRRSSGASTAAPIASPTPAATAAVPPTPATAPAVPPMLATAMSPRLQPQSSPARFSALRTVSRAIRRGMDALRNALIVLRNRDIRPTNEHRLTSPGYGRAERNDARWDEDAPGDAALLELFNRQRRRFL